jgi:hypothetical protein
VRRVIWGAIAIGVYLVTAVVTTRGPLPSAPVYDGLAPPAPYRYVNPPSDLADENETPLRAVGRLEFGEDGSRARTVATADGQMLVIFNDQAVAPRAGEDEVSVRITPLDPGPLRQPPDRLAVSGNAYRVDAEYSKSRDPVELEIPATVVIRYAVHATQVIRLEGRSWQGLETEGAQASFQLFAETEDLGTFAAAGIPERSRAWIAYAVAAAGVLAGAAGYVTGRRRRRRPPARRSSVRRRRPGRT